MMIFNDVNDFYFSWLYKLYHIK